MTGVAGLGYASWVVLHARKQQGYAPVLTDWIWHAGLPVVAYALLLVAGIVLRRSPGVALYLVEVIALGLLYVGIHNSWDSAVWLAMKGGHPGPPAGSGPADSRTFGRPV